MIRFLKRRKSFIYACLLFFSLLPFALKLSKEKRSVNSKKEQYNPELGTLTTIGGASDYIDTQFNKLGLPDLDTAKYVQITSKFTKERFVHGLARYDFADNWITFVGSKLVWDHLSAIVDPDDILEHSEGLCSQQTIVFMELLKKKGIKTRSVGLGYNEGPGHFLTEVYYGNDWHLYDVTMEPQWKKIKNDHKAMEYYFSNKDSLFVAYEGRLPKPTFDKIMEKVKYGEVGEFPAKNMLILHKATYYFTYFLPLFFIMALVRSYNKKKASALKNTIVQSTQGTEEELRHS